MYCYDNDYKNYIMYDKGREKMSGKIWG